MLSIYGTDWNNRYPADLSDTAKREWAEALAGYTAEQIKRGLEACRTRFRKPPSIAEFLDACRPPVIPEAHRPYQPPPTPPKSGDGDSVAQRELAKMRQILSGVRIGVDAVNAAKKGEGAGKVRTILGPGYTQEQYDADLLAAKAMGVSFYAVDMRAMARWGWTEEDEREQRRHALHVLGWPMDRLYLKGHEPPPKILAADRQACEGAA